MGKITDPALLQQLNGGASRPGVTIIPLDPYKAEANARAGNADNRADAGLAITQRNSDISARNAETSAGSLALAREKFDAEQRAKNNPQLTAAQRKEIQDKRGTLRNLASGISSLRKQYNDNFKGKGVGAAAEYLPALMRPANGVFNDKSGSLSAYVAAALGLSGQQFNTPAEQKLFIGSILPTASDTDEQIESKLNTLDELMGNADRTSAGQLGIPAMSAPPPPPNLNAAGSNLGAPTPGAASSGQTFSTPEDIALQQKLTAAYRQNAPLAALNQLSVDAGRGPLSKEWQDAVVSRDGGQPYREGTPPESGVAGMVQGALGSDMGAAGINYLNAAGAGIPQMLAGDQGFDALRNSSPMSSFGGEVLGGVTGALGVGAAFKQAGKAVSNPTVARLLLNPLAADTAYGASYGAATADDPLYGALGGALAGAGGSYVGGKVGQALFGLRSPTGVSKLTPGEQSVMGAINKTGPQTVEQALMQADQLGMPATLANVSPEVESLTGAAIRRSPTVAGQARQVVGQSSEGQIDRFRSAVGRDLGPIENIPQRSEDLITQAKATAGPLYDAFYNAPGADQAYDAVSGLMSRPSMQKAVGNAQMLAAEEGLAPPEGSWQSLDYIKRGLDDVVQANRSANMGSLDNSGRLTNNTLQEFLGIVDPLSGGTFPAARGAYAGPMQERGFLKAGQKAVTANPNQLGVDINGLSPQRLEQMRMGFTGQTVDNAEKLSNSTNPFRTLNTPAMEQRLTTMFGENPSVAQLLLQRDLEGQLASSNNRLVGNSMTAERQVADQGFAGSDILGPALEIGANVALGQIPIGTAIRGGLAQRAKDAIRLGVGKTAERKAEQIAPLALNPSPRDTIAQILALAQQASEYQAAKQALGVTGRRPGQIGGTSVAAALLPYLGE